MGTSPFIGEIMIFAGNFAPRGWAFCNGQLLPISQNTALFSILGTTYGGNGTSTFALPDLRGRVPIHWGQGPGLSPVSLGEVSGVEAVTLSPAQMPQHSHGVNASSASTTKNPSGGVPGFTAAGASYGAAPNGPVMNGAMVGNTGGGQPHENRPPYLALSFCIALQGIFPSRN